MFIFYLQQPPHLMHRYSDGISSAGQAAEDVEERKRKKAAAPVKKIKRNITSINKKMKRLNEAITKPKGKHAPLSASRAHPY